MRNFAKKEEMSRKKTEKKSYYDLIKRLMLSAQSREFYKFFLQFIVAALVFANFFSRNFSKTIFAKFRIFSLYLFSRKNAKFTLETLTPSKNDLKDIFY